MALKPKKKAAKKKTGRPSKFAQLTDLDKSNMEKWYRRGFTDSEVADFLGITQRTIDNWKKDHPEFFQSLKDWKYEADGKVEMSLYERACGYSHPEERLTFRDGEELIVKTTKHYPPDSTSCIFWLKNRKKEEWRDKHDVEHSGDISVTVNKFTEEPDK